MHPRKKMTFVLTDLAERTAARRVLELCARRGYDVSVLGSPIAGAGGRDTWLEGLRADAAAAGGRFDYHPHGDGKRPPLWELASDSDNTVVIGR